MLSFKEYSESKEIKTHYDILKNNPNPDPKEIKAAHKLGLITSEEHDKLLGLLKK